MKYSSVHYIYFWVISCLVITENSSWVLKFWCQTQRTFINLFIFLNGLGFVLLILLSLGVIFGQFVLLSHSCLYFGCVIILHLGCVFRCSVIYVFVWVGFCCCATSECSSTFPVCPAGICQDFQFFDYGHIDAQRLLPLFESFGFLIHRLQR